MPKACSQTLPKACSQTLPKACSGASVMLRLRKSAEKHSRTFPRMEPAYRWVRPAVTRMKNTDRNPVLINAAAGDVIPLGGVRFTFR